MIYRVQTECGIMDYNNLASAMNNARCKISKRYDVTLQLVGDDGLEPIKSIPLASWEKRGRNVREYLINTDPLCLSPIIEFLNI